MGSNPLRCRAALRQLDNRHATAGCLLSLLLVLPFSAHALSSGTLAMLAAVYAGVVVPLLAGYTTPGTIAAKLRKLMAAESLRYWLRQGRLLVEWLHHTFYQMDSIQTTTNQILFFMACEKVLCPEQRHSCLYVLLFYTVIAYLHRSLQTRHWTQLLHETTTADFLKLTTAFIVVRLGKAVAMSLVLLSFTIQFNHLEPTYSYVAITALYFLMTQFKGESGQDTLLVSGIRRLELQILEGFEEYWIPFLVPAIAIMLSGIVCFASREYRLLCLAVGYANVTVSWLKTKERFWAPLECQRAIVSRFARATARQMAAQGETTCAVCLDEMRPLMCRVTPCNHIFHSQCLHKCVLQFGQCPLCKRTI